MPKEGGAYEGHGFIWERLNEREKLDMLDSWSRQLDSHINELQGKTMFIDEEQNNLRREMDEIWAKLAKIIEAGSEFRDFSKSELLPGQTRAGILNAQLKGLVDQYRASQQSRFETVDEARDTIDMCRTAIRLIRESLGSRHS